MSYCQKYFYLWGVGIEDQMTLMKKFYGVSSCHCYYLTLLYQGGVGYFILWGYSVFLSFNCSKKSSDVFYNISKIMIFSLLFVSLFESYPDMACLYILGALQFNHFSFKKHAYVFDNSLKTRVYSICDNL
jgi:hypothetical protein